MSGFLRQSTSVKKRIGQFVDVGDGFTPETGVTIADTDGVETSVHIIEIIDEIQ